ncbi:DUF6456 domain-containing protein [Antarcticirhabdus aurantiaca]|uniref:DUF6456 domain-containing protein n=1 Tax=Antarcticirhabdus aurantiaca TaxID=2606717 RepID=A0ACD4NJA4_9HYPH|nr:DUF6456 domain-containing protein [Jeongeuplla avenae]
MEAWIARARRRAANKAEKTIRTVRKVRLTARSERMARALVVRGERSERRERPAATAPAGDQSPDIRFTEIDNPFYSRVHAGAPGNPAEIVVARNMAESPIVRLSENGTLTAAEAQAGLKFCGLYERAGRSTPSPSDYKQRVDGGGAADAFSDGRVRAGFDLREAHKEVGDRHYGIARFVAGEGHTLRELRVRLRCSKRAARQALRQALDALAVHWGIANRRSTTQRISDDDAAGEE